MIYLFLGSSPAHLEPKLQLSICLKYQWPSKLCFKKVKAIFVLWTYLLRKKWGSITNCHHNEYLFQQSLQKYYSWGKIKGPHMQPMWLYIYSVFAVYLRRHLKIHLGDKSYKCDQCDFASRHAVSLKKHLNIHSGEKPYKCSNCDYTSTALGNLKRHFKTHSEEKTYTCNQCNYASHDTSPLRTHLKTHSGERAYRCHQCDYRSNQLGNLRTHLKIHSGEKLHKCNQCDFASLYEGSLWGKNTQMQPMWLCINPCLPFEGAFGHSLWTKVAELQPMWFCVCLGR